MSAAQPRRWGWHRLTADWAHRIVDAASIDSGEMVLDLGAGDGALTAPLHALGARVLAVELHPGRAAGLRARYAERRHEVSVLELDIMDLRLPRRPFRVVANPPWSIAVPLLRLLTTSSSAMLSAHLVLQRGLVVDVARRGRALGPSYVGRDLGDVPATAFVPPPPGRAGLLSVQRRTRSGRR